MEEGGSSGSSKDEGWFGTGGISQSEELYLKWTVRPKIIAGLALDALPNLRNDMYLINKDCCAINSVQ